MALSLIDMRSVITVISFATFIGIVWWSWSSRRKGAFAEAARLPFADEEDIETTGARDTGNRHG